MKIHNERGIAMVLSLFLMTALSLLGASLMFLSQTETYASMNYRMMSQARYGAEAGVHKAINYLLNTYTRPGAAGDPLSNYNMNVSPVTFNNQPVVLSALASKASNYPAAATQTAFNAAAQGSLTAGNGTVNYAAYATLLSMQSVGNTVVQMWQITSDGTVGGARTATVEVTSTLEQPIVTASGYGAFAVSPTCGALTWSGGSTVDSYDSSNMTLVNGRPVTDLNRGDVGTNGNLTAGGSNTFIYGTLYTPRTGVGNCNNGAVDALTENGGADVTGGFVQLPQAINYTPPPNPSPAPPTTNMNVNNSASCSTFNLSSPATCSGSNSVFTINPNGAVVSLGDVALSGGASVTLMPGTYNVNSFSLAGNSTLVIGGSGNVIMNVMGTGKNTPYDLSGGSVSNATFDPMRLQVNYAGTDKIKLTGSGTTAAKVFAPNADISFSGGSDFYGSVVGNTLTDTGGTHYHYDRHLANLNSTPSNNYMLSSFTWKKY